MSEPIPVYAEMGSVNPVFILPGALRERGESLAAGLHASFTSGPASSVPSPDWFSSTNRDAEFLEKLRALTTAGSGVRSALLRNCRSDNKRCSASALHCTRLKGKPPAQDLRAGAALLEIDYTAFADDHSLHEELFGPSTLLITSTSREQMLAAARALDGHLTASILGTEDDLREYAELISILETKVGRVIFNGFPTGVEVTHAMVHGGPYPATSDGRSTSVGSQAIYRFARPVCYQNLPQSALPAELRDDNPRKILRLWNGAWQINR